MLCCIRADYCPRWPQILLVQLCYVNYSFASLHLRLRLCAKKKFLDPHCAQKRTQKEGRSFRLTRTVIVAFCAACTASGNCSDCRRKLNINARCVFLISQFSLIEIKIIENINFLTSNLKKYLNSDYFLHSSGA